MKAMARGRSEEERRRTASRAADLQHGSMAENRFKQQQLREWRPRRTAQCTAATLCLWGAAFVWMGLALQASQAAMGEVSVTYDAGDGKGSCAIDRMNEGNMCNVVLKADKDMAGPLQLFYQLDNFYQNHRQYSKSLDTAQLRGAELSEADLQSSCFPLVTKKVNGTNKLLNPCGLVPNSFFNDVITVTAGVAGSDVDTDVAWPSDVRRFANPADYPSELDDDVQYLFQSYPSVPKSKGILYQPFLVWLRISWLPTFRKLYAVIDADVAAGENITLAVANNFYVEGFGSKSLVLVSGAGIVPSKASPLPLLSLITGIVSVVLAMAVLVRHYTCPLPEAAA